MFNKVKVPISILIPTKNEEKNLERCLIPIVGWADEILILDSNSKDNTLKIADKYDTTVLQFDYKGGWPKKRQWALENYQFKNNWILLLDSDEILSNKIKSEIEEAILKDTFQGYWIKFEIYFLGKQLKYGGSELWKLSLFKKGKGNYEKRLTNQDISMADMEVHEHVVVEGPVSKLKNPVKHENFNSFSRYLIKHDEYSNWEAKLILEGGAGEVQPKLFGNQAQRRRFLKKNFLNLPGSPLIYFLYCYFFKLGILDGRQGFIYAASRAIYFFQIKVKVYESQFLNH